MSKRSRKVGSLKDTVPESEIINSDEVRNEPNYILPDGNYGIAGGYAAYSLVKKRIAYRTGNKEDGDNQDKVIRYEAWEDVPCYHADLVDIFKSYARILNLSEFKKKKMKGDINELVNIHKNTYNLINTALEDVCKPLSREQESIALLLDMKQDLMEEIRKSREDLKELNRLKKETVRELKEARKIIVDVDKLKKK